MIGICNSTSAVGAMGGASSEPKDLPDAVQTVRTFQDWLTMEQRARRGFGRAHDVLEAGTPLHAAFVACAEAVRGLSPEEVEAVQWGLRSFANAAARIPRG